MFILTDYPWTDGVPEVFSLLAVGTLHCKYLINWRYITIHLPFWSRYCHMRCCAGGSIFPSSKRREAHKFRLFRLRWKFLRWLRYFIILGKWIQYLCHIVCYPVIIIPPFFPLSSEHRLSLCSIKNWSECLFCRLNRINSKACSWSKQILLKMLAST